MAIVDYVFWAVILDFVMKVAGLGLLLLCLCFLVAALAWHFGIKNDLDDD